MLCVARCQNLAMFQPARTWLCCQRPKLRYVARWQKLVLLSEAASWFSCYVGAGFCCRRSKITFLLLEVRARSVFFFFFSSVSSLVISLLQLATFNSGCSNTVTIKSHIVHYRGQNMALLPEVRIWPSFQRSELFFYFFF